MNFIKNRSFLKGLLVLLILNVSFKSYSQPSTGLSQKVDLSKLKSGHPRLLLLPGEEKKIISQIKKFPEWQNVHEAILTECARIDTLPPVERIQIGKRLLDKSRECLRRVFQLSYAYRITRDPKYLKRAEKEMLAVAAFEDWNPSHFLDVAEMTLAVAIGYDWLYNNLSVSTREVLRKAIIEKGINPSFDQRYNGFVRSDNNWNQVCNAGMTFGALAVAEYEPRLAQSVIERALVSVPPVMKLSYSPDGVYPEGYSYWDYGTGFNVLLIDVLKKALGTDYELPSVPGFLKTPGFIQNIVGPIGLVHNWSDSGEAASISTPSFWFASYLKAPSILYGKEKYFAKENAKRLVGDRLLPTIMIWSTNIDISKIKTPKSRVWVGQGSNPVGFMRTSWTDPNAIFVGFKAGSASVNHGHMDVGSFVLDANGERWAMDFKNQDYNSLESKGIKVFGKSQDAQRWQIFRNNNFVHNTLTIDGQLQQVKGHAKINSWSEQTNQMTLTSDITPAYIDQLKEAKRGIAIINNQYTVVRDEITAPDKQILLRWTLLTPAKVRIKDSKTVELTQHGKTMLLIFDSSVLLEIKIGSTKPGTDYDAPNPGTYLVGFEASIPAGTTHYFNSFFTEKETVLKPVDKLANWPGR